MGINSVTFETKCWENDWKIMLLSGRIKKMIDRCNYPFSEKILYINNVNDRRRVYKAAEKLVRDGILTSAVISDDIAGKALDFFSISPESFKGGYYYSIQELAGIYNCKTDFLLHFSGDSIPGNAYPWINGAIKRMELDPAILVANPNWQERGEMAKNESDSEDDEFFCGYGFSDQCYLIRTADFKKQIYNESNEKSGRYPGYGGELFEKRVDSYMRNHGYKRITSKNSFYIHRNFPKNPVKKAVRFITELMP